MKEIKNQTDFHQLMQSIDNYGKPIKTTPAYISLEKLFMGKLLVMPKKSMKTYQNRVFMGIGSIVVVGLLLYIIFQRYNMLPIFSMLLAYSIVGIVILIIDMPPNYRKEMFLHRKEIAQELLISCQQTISFLEDTHKQHLDFIESDKFTNTSVVWFADKNISIEEKLDMYETQKEFLEACLKNSLHKKTSSKPTWLEALNCLH